MAFCKHPEALARETGSEYDETRAAGSMAPLSGVYACESCGRSVVARRGAPLPPADHHAHADADAARPVAWRLLVRAHWS